MRSWPGTAGQSTLNPSQSSAPVKTNYTTEADGDRNDSEDPIIGRFLLPSMSLVPMPSPSSTITLATVLVERQQPRNPGENGRSGSGHNRNLLACPPTLPSASTSSATFNQDDPVVRDDGPLQHAPAQGLHFSAVPTLNANAATESLSNYPPTSERTPELSETPDVSAAVGPMLDSIAVPLEGRSQTRHRPIGPSPASRNQAKAERTEQSRYPVDNRVTIRVPTPQAMPGLRKQWAIYHKQQLTQLQTRSGELLVYSDGSRRIIEGIRFAGAGVVGLKQGTALFQSIIALGSSADVYDAEMEGLAKGAEMVWQWMDAQGPGHGIRRVWFFADSTGALRRIYAGTPGRVHNCTIRFRLAAHGILDACPYLLINIEWVPAHSHIRGNETADAFAKHASAYFPIRFGNMFAMPAPTANRREVCDTAEPSPSNETDELGSPVLPSLNANAATNVLPDHASQPLSTSEYTPELSAPLEKPAVLSPPLSPAVRQYELGQVWQELVGQPSGSVIIPTEDVHDVLSELDSQADSVYDSESDADHVFGYASESDSDSESDYSTEQRPAYGSKRDSEFDSD